MKKTIFLTLILTLDLTSCKRTDQKKVETTTEQAATEETPHTDNTSDWKGSYVGILPCGSCLGINTEIILNTDNTYTKTMLFIDDNQQQKVKEGRFIWMDGVIILDDDFKTQLKIGDNFITVLDKNGTEHTGDDATDYILYKNICESKDFDEYTLKDKSGKEYVVIYGSGCDGAFVELKMPSGTNYLLLLKTSDTTTDTAVFENNQGVRFVEKDGKFTLFINGTSTTLH